MKKNKKKERNKKNKIEGNFVFLASNLLLCVLILLSACFSSICNQCSLIVWFENNYEIVDNIFQVIISIVTLVVSLISISISMQSDKIFGVNISELYKLRIKKHYSILSIVLISIVLCIISSIYYVMKYYISLFISFFAIISFLIVISLYEIPIMEKREKAFLKILKDNIKINHYLNKDLKNEVDEALKYLLYNKEFKELYLSLKDKDDCYNSKVFFILIETQNDLISDMKKYDEIEQKKISTGVIRNLKDIIYKKIDITDKVYLKLIEEKYYEKFAYVVYNIYKNKSLNNMIMQGDISSLLWVLYNSKDRGIKLFITSMLIVLTAYTVEKKDFNILKAVQIELSEKTFLLKEDTFLLTYFFIISLYLYYLSNLERDAPKKLKNKINKFIDEEGYIKRNTKIISWKNLHKEAVEPFNVNFNDYIYFLKKHNFLLEYQLYGTIKDKILKLGLFIEWYLTHLFNSYSVVQYDYSLIKKDKEIRDAVIEFYCECFNNGNKFKSTDKMNELISFYNYNSNFNYFDFFSICEISKEKFLNYIKELKNDKIGEILQIAKEYDYEKLEEDILNKINESLSEEWGFDSSIKDMKTEKHLSFRIEMKFDSVNFERIIENKLKNKIFCDLKKVVDKSMLFIENGTDFDSISTNDFIYISNNNICLDSLNSTLYQNFFKENLSQLKVVKSMILGKNTIIKENGFCFNCVINELKIRNICEKEMLDIIDKYKCEEDHYLFFDVFMTKENISCIINGIFKVIELKYSFQVCSSKDNIIEIKIK